MSLSKEGRKCFCPSDPGGRSSGYMLRSGGSVGGRKVRRDVKSRLGGYSVTEEKLPVASSYDTASGSGESVISIRESQGDHVGNMAKKFCPGRRSVKVRLGLKRRDMPAYEDKKPCSKIPRNNIKAKSHVYNKFQQPEKKSKICFDYKMLQNLSHQNPVELVTVLVDSESGFSEKLVDKLDSDWIMLMAEVLAAVCSVDFHESKTVILSQANVTGFLAQVEDHIIKLPYQTEHMKFSDTVVLLQNLSTFFQATITLLPNKAFEKLVGIVTKTEQAVKLMEALSENCEFPVALKERLSSLQQQLDDHAAERAAMLQKTSTQVIIHQHSPPNDFREISLFPTLDDIVNKKPFLRPNIITGRYENQSHYLDVQFRLLREDFVSPLRDGILEYIEQVKKCNMKPKRINNIRTYQNVLFLRMKIHKGVVCFEISLEGRKNVRGRKRFMFGSLLCFTADNFQNIYFGTVVDRVNSQLFVELKNVNSTLDVFDKRFVMVESEVYFEPYYHVLKALQHMKHDAFPMKRYIVNVQTDSRRPSYVQENVEFAMEGHAVTLVDDATWPTAAQLHLNDSQYAAFKAALTRELVLVQGPPGTGKTFLGLKIAQVLLANASVWNSDQRPMLVVCYTNHALDQFLEGLLQFTDSLVRVGSQSRNPALNDFHLKVRRKSEKNFSSTMYRQRQKIETLVRKMKEVEEVLNKIEKKECVLSLSWLVKLGIINQSYIESMHLKDARVIEWLAPDLFDAIDELAFLQAQFLGTNVPIMGYTASSHHRQLSVQPEIEDGEVLDEPWHCEPDDDFTLEPQDVNIQGCFIACTNGVNERLDNMLKELKHKNFHHEFLRRVRNLSVNIREAVRMLKFNLCSEWLKDGDRVPHLGQNAWLLSREGRWKLYYKWVKDVTTHLHRLLREYQGQVQAETKLMEETRNMNDLMTMRHSLVVGMTTTGAARLQSLLAALKPRIVIVEEAAEVMESHLTVSLTEQCQHLILIGDHQQLRPKAAVYRLCKDYHLDVSLFERMLCNGMSCEVLKVQHRMRPEIARLVSPVIYPQLDNHESVTAFEPLRGVSKSLFFVTHNIPEERAKDLESHVNTHEAEFLLALARHLVLQGYSPQDLTLLTTYSGQMFKAKELRSQEYGRSLEEMKIEVVDNYQGEENDIVLLSLVRSNEEAGIGFLKTENRVCVALSRARKGLYIIGNMECLARGGEVWARVRAVLEEQGALDTRLPLRCEVHPDRLAPVAAARDFGRVAPEGGCDRPCLAALPCGHACPRVCHATDREHRGHRCTRPCDRQLCVLMHKCPRECWQQCAACEVEVIRALPCGHTTTLPCKEEYRIYPCTTRTFFPKNNIQKSGCGSYTELEVTRDLLCGHQAELLCHEDFIVYKCEVQVHRELPCGHEASLLCSVDVTTYKCSVKVSKQLQCGHQRKLLCHADPQSSKCTVEVTVTLPHCSHQATKPCHQDTEVAQLRCASPCDSRLPCGHSCTLKCHALRDGEHLQYVCRKACARPYANCSGDHPCPAKCFEKCRDCPVKVVKPGANCSHPHRVACSTPAESVVCNNVCMKKLKCGHSCWLKCRQSCGDCKIIVTKTVEECGHTVMAACGETATVKLCSGPCSKTLACGHRCTQRCGDDCTTKCVQKVPSPVGAACGHAVSIPCYRRGPNVSGADAWLLACCTAPCGVLLGCGHRCAGTCGDCLQGRVHVSCREECSRTLICGHLCSSPCSRSCPPCDRKCEYRCNHSRCTRRCGELCYPCKEKCDWGCKHSQCSRLCYEPCDRQPCHRPCSKSLVCGHPCVGFCAYPCPPLCRVCHQPQLTEIFFGYEDEHDARFVFLEDCQHVFESRGLDEWMKQSDGTIKLKCCPLCSTPVMRTRRFVGSVKQMYEDVTRVKRKIRGDETLVKQQRQTLLKQVCDIQGDEFLIGCKSYVQLVRRLLDALGEPSRAPSVSELDCLRVLVELVQAVADTCLAVLGQLRGAGEEQLRTAAGVLFRVILLRGRKVSEQEVEDVKLELARFHRLSQLLVLESELGAHAGDPGIAAVHERARALVTCIERYSTDQDARIKDDLQALAVVVKTVIRDRERREIVAAVGMKQGHWFKCPRGHPYVIADCGGAMQVGRCNECGSSIGGMQHRLLADNALAPEMDGAARPAWPGM